MKYKNKTNGLVNDLKIMITRYNHRRYENRSD